MAHKTVTPEQYAELKARHALHEAWRNGRTSYDSGSVPLDCRISNDERSAIEVYEFVNDPPEHYFLYVETVAKCADGVCYKPAATTWTGDTLGYIDFGREYRDNFGGKRVPITVHAINGRTYHGTYYKSSGDYARVRMAKSQRKAA